MDSTPLLFTIEQVDWVIFFYNSASAAFEEHKNTCGLPGLC